MSKRVFRYFFSFLETQEKWLNKMACNGFRLIRTTKLSYEFETCERAEYEYCVEFIADKSYKEAVKYREFLEEMGYRTFTKNLHINYSIGKMKWRPWAKGAGQIATNPGAFNKELLILEKKRDGKPFELHTDYNDLIQYYTPIRNSYLTVVALMIFILLGSCMFDLLNNEITSAEKIMLAAICVLSLIPTIKYSKIIQNYKEMLKTNEH